MTHDPFWHQKRTKNENERRILSEIRDESPTFTELQHDLRLSKSVLSEHLKKLENGGEIARNLNGRRIEYVTTERGRESERQRLKSLANVFGIIGQLTRTKALSDIFRLGEEAPEYFDAFAIWLGDLAAFVMSDEFLGWVRKHPGAEGRRIMTKQLTEQLGVPFDLGTSPIPETAETLERLQRILDTMREVVDAERRHPIYRALRKLRAPGDTDSKTSRKTGSRA